MLMEDISTMTKHDVSGIGPHSLAVLYTSSFGEKFCGCADLVVMGENGSTEEHIYGRWACGFRREGGVLTVGPTQTIVPLTVGGLLVGLELTMEIFTGEDGPGICGMLTGSPLLSDARILSRIYGVAGP